MDTAAPAKAKKAIPPQVDVRIVGGRTTVKIRAAGDTTLARMAALLTELATNAATHKGILEATRKTQEAMIGLNLALGLGFSGLTEHDLPAIDKG